MINFMDTPRVSVLNKTRVGKNGMEIVIYDVFVATLEVLGDAT